MQYQVVVPSESGTGWIVLHTATTLEAAQVWAEKHAAHLGYLIRSERVA